MVKNTKQEEVSTGHRSTLSDALNYVDSEFGAWVFLAAKFGAVFAVWMGMILLGRAYVTSPDLLEILAIGYWFGWMFVVCVAVIGVFVAVSGWLDQLSRSSPKSKY